jgi:hypothetical protein
MGRIAHTLAWIMTVATATLAVVVMVKLAGLTGTIAEWEEKK